MWLFLDPMHRIECQMDDLSQLSVMARTVGLCNKRIPKAWLIIPGFGLPEIEKKTRWLHINVARIRSTIPDTWHLLIFVSSYSPQAAHMFRSALLPRFPSTWWFVRFQESLLGEFFLSSMRPEMILDPLAQAPGVSPGLTDGPVMILLDDVELMDGFHTNRMYDTLLVHDLHLISPIIDRSSVSGHKFMFRLWPQRERVFRRTNYAEMFFYMMTVNGYRKWHGALHPQTVYMWGIDMILFPRGVRIGIDETFSIRHHICSKLTGSPHYRRMQAELRMYSSRNPDNIKFRFRNLWIEKDCMSDDRQRQRVLMTDTKLINPPYDKLKRQS